MSEFSKAVARVDLDAQTKKLRTLVSPSQVETWDQCNRKWVFAYIFGLKTPPGEGQVAGTELHAECEHTSNTGGEVRDTKWKAVVQKALAEGLILIGDNIKNEQWIEIPTYPDGPTMRGKYDAVDFTLSVRTGYVGLLREGVMGDVLTRLVNDYKSTKNFRWNKTPAELAKNIQLSTYGLAILRAYPDDTHIALRHTYLRTEGAAAATKSEVVVPRARILSNWAKTKTDIRNMQQLVRDLPREESAITSVEPTLTHCSAFRGCPYRSMCGLGNETFSFTGLTSDGEVRGLEAPRVVAKKDFSFEEDLTPARDRAWDDDDETFSFSELPAPRVKEEFSFAEMAEVFDPESDDTEEKKMGLLEDMLNGTVKTPLAPKAIVATATEPTAPAAAAVKASDKCQTCNGKRYVPNPAKDAMIGSFVPCKMCGKTSITPPDQPDRDAGRLPPVVEATEEAPKARRGRPKKEAAPEASMKIFVEDDDGTRKEITDEAKEAAATAREGALDDAEQEKKERIAKAALEVLTKKPKASKEGIAIYIDCLPQKGVHSGEGIDYLEWLAPVAERVATAKKVVDWRIIPFSAEGELAAEIHATIKKSGLPPVVLVSGSSRARAPFLEVAGMFASTVIVAVGR